MRSRRVLRNQKNKRNTKNLRKRTNFRKLANAKTRRLRARSKVGTKRRYTKKTRKGGSAPRVIFGEGAIKDTIESVLGPASGAAPESLPYGAIVFDVDDTLYPHICGHKIEKTSFNPDQITLIKRIKEILTVLKGMNIKLFVITRCRPIANILNEFFTKKHEDPDAASLQTEIKYNDLIPSKHIFGADWTDPHAPVDDKGEWSDLRVWNSTKYPFDTNYSVIKSEFLNQIREKHSGGNILFVDDDRANAKVAQSRGFNCITTPTSLGKKGGGMIMTIRGLESVFGIPPNYPEGSTENYPEIPNQLDLGEGSFEFLAGSTQKLTFMNSVNNLPKYLKSVPRVEVTLDSQVFNPKRKNFRGEDLEITFQSILNDITNYVNKQLQLKRQGAIKGKPSPPETTENEGLGNLFQTVAACLDDEQGKEVSIKLGEALQEPSTPGERSEMIERVNQSFKRAKTRAACRTTKQHIEIIDAIKNYEVETEVPPPTEEEEVPPPLPPKIGNNYIITGINREKSELILSVNKNGSYLLRTSSKGGYALSINIGNDKIIHYRLKEAVEGANKIFKIDGMKVTDFLNEKQNELQTGFKITQIKQKRASA